MVRSHKWAFASRLRARAFSWKSSQLAAKRIREAVSEVRKAAKGDVVLGAIGASLVLGKIVPAIENVDGSSGSIGNAVRKAVGQLVPFVAALPADAKQRPQVEDRIWQAYEEDGYGYLDTLGEHWGKLCGSAQRASTWADDLLVHVNTWLEHGAGGYLRGFPACLACLLAADRHEELLSLLRRKGDTIWDIKKFGVLALAALGRKGEALAAAEAERGQLGGYSDTDIDRTCEELLLTSGMRGEAYRRYAFAANQKTTNLATWRAIARRYPEKEPTEILRDLIATSPGNEGIWFASARAAGDLELALELARKGPCDPRTLNRAARDLVADQPQFALEFALCSLRGMALGWGYEITDLDVREAHDHACQAAASLGVEEQLPGRLATACPENGPATGFVRKWLGR